MKLFIRFFSHITDDDIRYSCNRLINSFRADLDLSLNIPSERVREAQLADMDCLVKDSLPPSIVLVCHDIVHYCCLCIFVFAWVSPQW